jgi:hypothetical protein
VTRVRLVVATGLGLALGFFVSPVEAVTRCVKPAPAPTCLNSIQQAVALSAPGDIVAIGPGVYFENVLIPAGKDGLQLVGASKLTTVIDADLPRTGSAIGIFSNGVKVKNLGVRNGLLNGIEIDADDVVVQGVRIVGLRNSAAVGILASFVNRLQVIGNEIRAVGGSGILVTNSTNAVVTGNTLGQVPVGIHVEGAGHRVAGNKVVGARSVGLAAHGNLPGDGVVVSSNLIELTAGVVGLAVSSSGVNPVVSVLKNKLTNTLEARVDCLTCSDTLVAGNTSLGSWGRGLDVTALGQGLVVTGNKVSRAAGAAFVLAGTGIEASLNTASDTGVFGPDGHCFVANAPGSSLSRNTATRCAGDGFAVDGDDAVTIGSVTANTATSVGASGFRMTGNISLVANNKALSSNAAGYRLVAPAAVGLSGNVGAKNRYGLCPVSGVPIANSFGFPPTSTVCDVIQ